MRPGGLVALLFCGAEWLSEKFNDSKPSSYVSKYEAEKLEAQKYPEPHRTEDGRIIIENCKLYNEDVRKYGAYQAQKWVKQGKYNLEAEALARERMRIERNMLHLSLISGGLSEKDRKRLDELNKMNLD